MCRGLPCTCGKGKINLYSGSTGQHFIGRQSVNDVCLVFSCKYFIIH